MEPGRYLLAAERSSRPAGAIRHCLLADARSSSFVHKPLGTMTSHNLCILVCMIRQLQWPETLHKVFDLSVTLGLCEKVCFKCQAT